MTLKETGLFIQSKITEKYRYQSAYCQEHGRTKQRVNEMLNGIIFDGKTCKVSNIEEILNDLGYELVLSVKEKSVNKDM